jgi:predicted small metal-binding protein
MGKVLRCGDLVAGCGFEARGTEEEILEQAAPHAKQAHGLEVTADLVAAVRQAMKEEPAQG